MSISPDPKKHHGLSLRKITAALNSLTPFIKAVAGLVTALATAGVISAAPAPEKAPVFPSCSQCEAAP